MLNDGDARPAAQTWRSVGEGHVEAAERRSGSLNNEAVVDALLAIYCELRYQHEESDQRVDAMQDLAKALRDHAADMQDFGPR